MDQSIVLISVGVTGLLICVGSVCIRTFDRYGASVGVRLRQESKSRDQLMRTKGAGKRAANGESSPSGIRDQLVPNRGNERQRYQSRLIQAGIYGPDALSTFFTVKLVLMLAPPVVAIVIAAGLPRANYALPMLLGCIVGVAGMLAPSFWLERRILARHRVLRRALPDMLDLMTVCLEGGLSLQGTIQRVGDELATAHPTLAGEFAIVQREIDLGVPVHAALQRLADRTGCSGFRRLTTCVRDAQRQGTDLAGALRVHSDSLRDQREMEAEEAAQKASVKILIPTLLCIFPAVFVVLAGPAAIRIHESFSQTHESHVTGSP